MGINSIDLPAITLEQLYGSTLVEEKNISKTENHNNASAQKESIPVSNTSSEQAIRSLGSNNKKILIVVRSAEAVHLPDNELNFLTGILTACNLSLADVAIVNLNNHPEVSYKEITSSFASNTVLLFDIDPAAFGLPMSFPYYQVQPFAGNSFLYAPALKDLENDKVEKSKLWVSLKRLFHL